MRDHRKEFEAWLIGYMQAVAASNLAPASDAWPGLAERVSYELSRRGYIYPQSTVAGMNADTSDAARTDNARASIPEGCGVRHGQFEAGSGRLDFLSAAGTRYAVFDFGKELTVQEAHTLCDILNRKDAMIQEGPRRD